MCSFHRDERHRTQQMFPAQQGHRKLQYHDERFHNHGCCIQKDAQGEPRQKLPPALNHCWTWHVQGRRSMDPLE